MRGSTWLFTSTLASSGCCHVLTPHVEPHASHFIHCVICQGETSQVLHWGSKLSFLIPLSLRVQARSTSTDDWILTALYSIIWTLLSNIQSSFHQCMSCPETKKTSSHFTASLGPGWKYHGERWDMDLIPLWCRSHYTASDWTTTQEPSIWWVTHSTQANVERVDGCATSIVSLVH